MTRGGFTDERWRTIARLISSVKPCGRIVVFGSRAKGVWREGSDVYLAVWSFDVVLPAYVKEDLLLEHIERVGFEIAIPSP